MFSSQEASQVSPSPSCMCLNVKTKTKTKTENNKKKIQISLSIAGKELPRFSVLSYHCIYLTKAKDFTPHRGGGGGQKGAVEGGREAMALPLFRLGALPLQFFNHPVSQIGPT